MADEDDEGFSFGDFKSATLQPSTSTSQNDNVWGDFFFSPSPQLSNGFSLSPQNQSNSNFDAIGFSSANLARPTSNPSSIKPDLGPNKFRKPNGALPLSLFGEVEDEKGGEVEKDLIFGDGVKKNSNLNGGFDPNLGANNGKVEVGSVSNGVGFNNGGDFFGKLYVQNQQIKGENGSGLKFDGSGLKFDGSGLKFDGSGLDFGGSGSDLNNNDEDGDDDEWEFMDASSRNLEENSDSVASSQSKVEPVVVMVQEKQAGQDASYLAEHHPSSSSSSPQFVDLFAPQQDASYSAQHHAGSSSSSPQFVDLFVPHHDALHKSSEMDVGFNFKSNTGVTNGSMPDLFLGVEETGNKSEMNATSVNEDDDFDDFGDFMDASQEVGSSKQEQVAPQTTPAEAQLPNGKLQNKQTQPEGALPLSLFSDGTEDSNDGLDRQVDLLPKPTSTPKNGFSGQGPGMSIHDLLSNLYSQAQQSSSVESNMKPAESGVHFPTGNVNSPPLSGDDDWDDNSWEFKDAISETGVKEQSSSDTPGNVSQKPSETSSNLHLYMDFYSKLRDALCFLLSNQLDEEKIARIGNDGTALALGNDIQDAYKVLEDSMISQEALSKKHLERSTCLNEALEALQGLSFKVIESEYSLSKKLQMAANDWRTAAELLRHAISVLHILSLGSADELSVYVSTWSKIINVCAEELRNGALIWKRVSEKNVRHQILSDHRGQQYIQALGEIYKVVELLGLSAKLYKPWMLLSFPHSPLIVTSLDECRAVWVSSGLEEALQIISDSVDFGCHEAAKALIASIKNIRDLDVYAVHDCASSQQFCRLSLLPPEMLEVADLKMVSWNDESYFLNFANLWANLISCNPPQLPHLQVR